MPDADVGIGATVGSVAFMEGAIVPAAVGVDIGCGMIAARTNLSAYQLPDDLAPLLALIEQRVPRRRRPGPRRSTERSTRDRGYAGKRDRSP